jgi:hypothetical protein
MNPFPLLFAALALAGSALAAPVATSIPLCRVQAVASSSFVLGFYKVTVRTTETLSGQPCPPNGYAVIRLEGGRQYPLTVVTPAKPFVRFGVPWYWRLSWQAISGALYGVPVKGLNSPFGETKEGVAWTGQYSKISTGRSSCMPRLWRSSCRSS